MGLRDGISQREKKKQEAMAKVNDLKGVGKKQHSQGACLSLKTRCKR